MSEPYIWGNLSRTINDPTKVDEAISEAVAAHNDDPDAHLEAGQALESHRAAEIIDHRAESVVNDKLASVARTWTAIVGSGLEGDFLSLQAAVEYVISVGGGSIFLENGDYYLSGKVDLKGVITIAGRSKELCTINGDYTGGDYLNVAYDSSLGSAKITFENVTLQSSTTGVVMLAPYSSPGVLDVNSRCDFYYCNISGPGVAVLGNIYDMLISDSSFYCGSSYLLGVGGTVNLEDCDILALPSGSNRRFIQVDTDKYELCNLRMRGCTIGFSSSWASNIFDLSTMETINAFDSIFYGMNQNISFSFNPTFDKCTLNLGASGYITLNEYGGRIEGCTIRGGTGNRIRLSGTSGYCMVVNNNLQSNITDNGEGNMVANNITDWPY